MHDQPHDVMTFEEAMTYPRILPILALQACPSGQDPVAEGWAALALLS